MHPSLPSSLVRLQMISFFLRHTLPPQIGHFFWMVLVAICIGWLFASGWIVFLVLSVELVSFFAHAINHHDGESWFTIPFWPFFGLLGSAIAVTGLCYSPILLALSFLIIPGSQVTSYGIHRLAHRRPSENWSTVWSVARCVRFISAGLTLSTITSVLPIF